MLNRPGHGGAESGKLNGEQRLRAQLSSRGVAGEASRGGAGGCHVGQLVGCHVEELVRRHVGHLVGIAWQRSCSFAGDMVKASCG